VQHGLPSSAAAGVAEEHLPFGGVSSHQER